MYKFLSFVLISLNLNAESIEKLDSIQPNGYKYYQLTADSNRTYSLYVSVNNHADILCYLYDKNYNPILSSALASPICLFNLPSNKEGRFLFLIKNVSNSPANYTIHYSSLKKDNT